MKTKFEELTVNDIVNEFPKYQHLVNEQLTLEQTKNLTEKITSCLKTKENVWSEEQMQNVINYSLSLDDTRFMDSWSQFTGVYTPILAKGISDREDVVEELGENCVKFLQTYSKSVYTRIKKIVDLEDEKKHE